jgi:hypothetical protein
MRTDAASPEPLEAHDATKRNTKKPQLEKPENLESMSASAKDSLEKKCAIHKNWKHAPLGLTATKYGLFSTQTSLV